MSTIVKQLFLSIIFLVVYIWLAAWFWSQLPDVEHQWWVIPAYFTTVVGGVSAYVAGCYWPFNEKR